MNKSSRLNLLAVGLAVFTFGLHIFFTPNTSLCMVSLDVASQGKISAQITICFGFASAFLSIIHYEFITESTLKH